MCGCYLSLSSLMLLLLLFLGNMLMGICCVCVYTAKHPLSPVLISLLINTNNKYALKDTPVLQHTSHGSDILALIYW